MRRLPKCRRSVGGRNLESLAGWRQTRKQQFFRRSVKFGEIEVSEGRKFSYSKYGVTCEEVGKFQSWEEDIVPAKAILPFSFYEHVIDQRGGGSAKPTPHRRHAPKVAARSMRRHLPAGGHHAQTAQPHLLRPAHRQIFSRYLRAESLLRGHRGFWVLRPHRSRPRRAQHPFSSAGAIGLSGDQRRRSGLSHIVIPGNIQKQLRSGVGVQLYQHLVGGRQGFRNVRRSYCVWGRVARCGM